MAQTGTTPTEILKSFPEAGQPHDNTWRNWREKKTIMRISDLEFIAKALGVPAALLLTPPDGAVSQMELPFDDEKRSVRVELECLQNVLRIKGV